MSLFQRAAFLSSKRLARSLRAAQLQLWQSYSAAPAPAGDDDLVLEAFQEQQKSYRDLLNGMKKITVPLSLDPGAVKKYAAEMEALKRKVGLPEMDELMGATLNHQMKLSGGNMRKFLHEATEGVDLGQQEDILLKVNAALDKIEESSGPVTIDNPKALAAFQSEVANIAKQNKLDNVQAVKPQAIIDMYTEQLKDLRQAAEDDIEVAKRRDGLEDLTVDISSIAPKFA